MHARLAAPLLAAALLAAACSQSNSSDCTGDAVVCGGQCVSTRSDNLNCGACGNACAAGLVCSGGSCAVTCAAGLVDCGGKCVDPMTDRAFCGASGACTGATDGTVCASGQVCSNGACALSCQAGLVNCGGTCVDPLADPRHCGADAACGGGQTCAAGFACSAGACALSCQPGLVNCGGRCVDPMTDRAFCGASGACSGATNGTVCGSGEVCAAGACATSCPAGQLACGGSCVDPQADPNWCGATASCAGGVACGPSAACYQGRCEPLCPAGQVMCGGACIDPLTDRTYCGASGYCTGASAGVACLAFQACVAGACSPPACQWQNVAAFPLSALPAGASYRNGAIGSQGVQTVSGRSAWRQLSDWNMLILPIVPAYLAASDDVFAVEADVFVPAATTADRGAGLVVFGDPDPNPANACAARSKGLLDFAWTRVGGTAEVRWAQTDGCPPGGAGFNVVSTTAITPFSGRWATLRLEGTRSGCRFRTLVDGQVVSTWTGTCDMTGDSLTLYGRSGAIGSGSADVSWSNLRIDRGNPLCVP